MSEPKVVTLSVEMVHSLDEMAVCWRVPGGEQFALTVLRGVVHAHAKRGAGGEDGRRSFHLLSSLQAIVREQGFDIPF
jgi:hypothetical protein